MCVSRPLGLLELTPADQQHQASFTRESIDQPKFSDLTNQQKIQVKVPTKNTNLIDDSLRPICGVSPNQQQMMPIAPNEVVPVARNEIMSSMPAASKPSEEIESFEDCGVSNVDLNSVICIWKQRIQADKTAHVALPWHSLKEWKVKKYAEDQAQELQRVEQSKLDQIHHQAA